MPQIDEVIQKLSLLFSADKSLLSIALNLLLLFAIAFFFFVFTRLVLRHGVSKILKKQKSVAVKALLNSSMLKAVSRMAPWIVIQLGITLLPNLDATHAKVIQNVATAILLLYGILAINAFLNGILDYYIATKDMRIRSIKSYVQLSKIAIYVMGSICIISVLINRSPVILLSGLGAMSAVTMLVFKDTILSFVSGVQISTNDLLRLGDWIEMPQVDANGEVIDIALQVVKVQNFDKTITTIPTWRLMQESFKNWRGMRESGGRRIKRPLYLDTNSISFLQKNQIQELLKIRILNTYLTNKLEAIEIYNDNLGEAKKTMANCRNLSNIGTFRAYAKAYLDANARINHEMTCMVRLMEPTPQGLPLEIYCFTNTVQWMQYEEIQSDIFEHLITMLPAFGLRVYQQPTGYDFIALQSDNVSSKKAADLFKN